MRIPFLSLRQCLILLDKAHIGSGTVNTLVTDHTITKHTVRGCAYKCCNCQCQIQVQMVCAGATLDVSYCNYMRKHVCIETKREGSRSSHDAHRLNAPVWTATRYPSVDLCYRFYITYFNATASAVFKYLPSEIRLYKDNMHAPMYFAVSHVLKVVLQSIATTIRGQPHVLGCDIVKGLCYIQSARLGICRIWSLGGSIADVSRSIIVVAEVHIALHTTLYPHCICSCLWRVCWYLIW